jgi:anti-sigma regulatory factor (Ser/Thr protein kinase)
MARTFGTSFQGSFQRSFPRDVASLDGVFKLISDFSAANRVGDAADFAVRLAVEELFVNMVKYNPGNPNAIRIEISSDGTKIVVSMTDFGVEPFDVTRAPEYNGNLPLAARLPGGLGIHLARKVMDDVEYVYENGQSTITLTKLLGGSNV